jgi:peptide/nickel transport system substrate-binding protein
MGGPFNRRSLLVGGAATAAGLAGASALGFDLGGVAGATTNGVGRNGISTAKPKKGGTLVFGVDAEESGFNPTTARFDEVGVMYARTVFDPLAIIDTQGAWQPYLAETITPNADHTAWTITVRPNVLFHDGTACDGPALLTNFKAQQASLLLGTLILNPIVDSIVAAGPLAVTLNLKSPWVSFPLYLAGGIGGQSAYMCAPSMLAATNGGTLNPVGTGPFVFKQWVPNSHFTATANPHYWRPGLPHLDAITFKPIVDAEARAEALKSGTIDIMITDTPQVITQFRGNKSYAYIDDGGKVVGQPDMNSVMLNTASPPFNNPSIRRAAAMAINRAEYAKEIDDNVLPVSTGLFTPGSPYQSKTAYPPFNPTEAKKLVKQVAQSTGKPVSFTWGSTNSPTAEREQQYLQQAWEQVGFKVTNTIVQQNDLINKALAGSFQALEWRQFGAVDPDLNYIFWSTTTILSSSLSINMARNVDPTLQAALELGRTQTDPSARAKAYQTVNKRLAIDLPYLWLDRAVWAVVSTPKVQNWNNPTTAAGKPAYGMIGGSVWPTQIWLK